MIQEILNSAVKSKLYPVKAEAKRWQAEVTPQITENIKAQLLAEILKEIGEDEYIEAGAFANDSRFIRNWLRQELRTKFKELFNVKEK